MKTREAGLSWLLAASVLLPLWAWSPSLASPWRLQGAIFSLVVLVLAVAAMRRAVQPLPGTLLFLGSMAAGLPVLFLRSGPPPWGGLADRAPLLSAWVLAVLAASRPALLRRAAASILTFTALASFYAVLQIAGWDPLGWRPEPHSAPTAPFPHTNAAAEILAPMLVAAAAWPATGGKISRAAWGAILAMAFPLGFFGVAAARLTLPLGLLFVVRRNRGKLPAALLILGVYLGGEGLRMLLPAPPPAEAISPTLPGPAIPASMQVRWLMDRACLGQALAHPAGSGLGSFETRYPFWRPREELRLSTHEFADPATPRPATPHSEPLLALVELGWGGALLLGAALFLLLRCKERASWTTAPLLVLGCHALVRAPLTGNPPALALAALLAVAARKEPQSAPSAPSGLLRRLLPPLIALVAAAAVPSQLGGELALASRLASLREKQAPDPGDAIEALEARPWDAVAASFHVADLTREHAPPERIRTALDALLRHDPANLFGLTALYHLEMVAADGSRQEALRALERAEALAPDHPSVRTGRTIWLAQAAEGEKEAGLSRAARGDPAARHHLLGAALLAALVAVRNQDLEQARSALWEASAFADSSRALVERTAARADLDEALLRALALRLDAARESDLGPPPIE